MSQKPENIHACSYIWTISNLAVCPLLPGRRLFSPLFTVENLGHTNWRLVLFPKGEINSDYLSLFLKRELDGSELKEIVLDFKLTIECIDSRFRYMKISRNICFKENEVSGFSEFTRWDSTHAIDRVPPYDAFVIRCDLSPSDEIGKDLRWNQRMDLNVLSQDLSRLFKRGLHSDITLCSGGFEFRAHKAVLASRSSKFLHELCLQPCSRKDMSDIPAPILGSLLSYLYSGKLEIPLDAVPGGLLTVGVQYLVSDLVQRLRMFPKTYYARTVLEFEHKFIDWNVRVLSGSDGDFLGSWRVLELDKVYCDSLTICCQVVDDTKWGNGSYVNMSFKLSNVAVDFPVFMLVMVHVVDRVHPMNSTLELYSGHHQFESDSEWHQTFPIDELRLDGEEVISLGFEIDMCDGTYTNSLQEEDVIIPNKCPIGLDDFRQFSHDLQRLFSSSVFADFSIVCGGETFQVHKAILSARSPVFEKMLEHDMIEKRTGSALVKDVRPAVMKLMLSYMYSGVLDDQNHEDICDLYEVSDRYALFILKERCSYVLVENLCPRNVQNVLDLARRHFDLHLECEARSFLRSHAAETELNVNAVDSKPVTSPPNRLHRKRQSTSV